MENWTFCKDRLSEVSRSFAIPIGMLRERLEVAVTCGYLLCRVVDTVEDDATLSIAGKSELFARFLTALHDPTRARAFEEAFVAASGISPESSEHLLARELSRLLNVAATLPPRHVGILRRWVAEMTRGMALYGHRPADDGGLVVLATLADLERYCYFVAGTVGHLLTELFLDELGPLPASSAVTLRYEAEEFGVGLQLVNILKDITDDYQRGWCFVPRTLLQRNGLEAADVLAPESRRSAHAAIAPLFERAERGLHSALRYSLALPADAADVRMFCLIPLWMAARTLAVARDNDAQLTPGQAVKIDRAEVVAIVADCQARAGDDRALSAGFEQLFVRSPFEHAPQGSRELVA